MKNLEKMNEALQGLCSKYGVVAKGTMSEDGGMVKLTCACGKETILLPWRVERKFAELKKMLNGTLEDLSTLRFCSVGNGGCLKCRIARELDLATFFTGEKIATVFAVCGAEKNSAANVIAKLANDVNVSIECSTKLPAGAEPIDRHELIASRGVASDQVVDTQVPQSSVYVYTDKGEERYTDTDTELFGFSYEEIWTIRAAFAALSNTALFDEWNEAYKRMTAAAEATIASDAEKTVKYL